MIKVFVGDAETVEIATNQFMTDKGKDFPVRTNTEVVNDKIVYVATVFYDGVKKETNVPKTIPIDIADIQPKLKSDKIGALWQRGKVYSGTIEIGEEQKPLVLTQEQWDKLETQDTKAGNKMKIGHYKDMKFRIIGNQFKTAEKHPDFVIMSAD
jgi:hypothetical protein